MRKQPDQAFQQRLARVGLGNFDRSEIVIRDATRQRRTDPPNRLLPLPHRFRSLLFRAAEAIGARLPFDVARVELISGRQRRLAGMALSTLGFVKSGIHTDALIKHKALTIVVCSPAFLEVFQDAAIKLIDLLESFANHEWSRFFTANPSRAEGDNRLLLQLFG